ncbi:hypothetical protein [Gramella sp. AN32]|uniref:Uncharacterized protein n=1 Tax=Christiangramia antarctica TaxID=2058158 RepID=A0ABW5X9W9_9FLAO|nr:hypothetical protein [Gramella sp. AN32]MCM4155501.1 hypothetical protein [Gramella sp. AN32]
MRFFRKIRRKLLISGKFKDYLLYALGEILLISIGILIAWKINDLNEIRKNHIVQVKIYESLYEELNTNLDVLDSAIVRYDQNTREMLEALNYVGKDTDDLNLETRKLLVQVKFRNSNLRDEALSSVNNTDKFQFLENDSLTELIAQYPTEIKTFRAQELKISNLVENKLKPILEEHISLIDLLEENNTYKQIKTFGKQSNYSDLMESKEYQNAVVDQMLQTQIQSNVAIELREKTALLAAKLERELD